MRWQGSCHDECHDECRGECGLSLSRDGSSVSIAPGRRYVVSFALNLHVDDEDFCAHDAVSICVRTHGAGRREDVFICRAHVDRPDKPVTVSAAGILVSSHCYRYPAELSLALVSPSSCKIMNGSLSVAEVE